MLMHVHAVDVQDTCPVCRQQYKMDQVHPAMPVRRIVLGLEVLCPLTYTEPDGAAPGDSGGCTGSRNICTWRGPLQSIDSHKHTFQVFTPTAKARAMGAREPTAGFGGVAEDAAPADGAAGASVDPADALDGNDSGGGSVTPPRLRRRVTVNTTPE